MPYILDKDGDHAIDKDGNKIEFTVDYIDDSIQWINDKTEQFINDNGHSDIKDRHSVINDGNANDHAISKSDLDAAIASFQQQITSLQNEIKNSGNT